jgi:polyhydroxybutyrate depolymerase
VGARPEEVTLRVDGRTRRAVMIAPADTEPAPVVMLLHGSGGSGEWAVNETRWDEKAAAEGILLLAPDATRPEPDSPPRFYTNPAVWNDGSGRLPANRVAHVDDVGFLGRLIDEVARRRSIDPARIFVTGFSNGAGMTFRLARELAGGIAAIAPIAGYDSGGPKPVRRVPTLFMIGTSDPLLPVAGGVVNTPWADRQERRPIRDMLARWASDNGLSSQPTESGDEDGVSRERWGNGLEAWFIAGLGHHWPGGRAGLNRRIAGPPSNAVDATAAVWEFFRLSRGAAADRSPRREPWVRDA